MIVSHIIVEFLFAVVRLAKTGFEDVLTGNVERVDLNESGVSTSSQRSRIKFRSEPRIPANSGFMVEMLTGIYFAM